MKEGGSNEGLHYGAATAAGWIGGGCVDREVGCSDMTDVAQVLSAHERPIGDISPSSIPPSSFPS